jgi:MoxR-like ATPase
MSSDPSLLEFLKSNPTMFQNYQAIVIKTLLENDSEYNESLSYIKSTLVELNFDREDFEINSAWSTVKKVLVDHNVISINGKNVKLNNKNISDVEKTECLKICGEKILQHHVNKLMKKENQCYFIRPGANGEFWKEFRTNNFVAVDYLDQDKPDAAGDFDLSGLTKDEISKRKGNTDDNTELFNISQIKKGDIIAIVNNLKTIEEFAIVINDYYYKKSVNQNKHRVDVEFLNFGTSEIGNPVRKGIMKDTQNKIKDFLTGDKLEYFMLRHAQKGKEEQTWNDEIGKIYHVGRQADGDMGHNVQKLRDAKVGSKAVWISDSIKNSTYVLGYGTIKSIETRIENKSWNVVFENFIKFKNDGTSPIKGKKMSDLFLSQIQLQVKESKSNWQHSVNKISKKLYQQIIGEDLTPEEDELDAVAETRFQYLIDENKEKQIRQYKKILDQSKGQIIFYGPPGTGKTYIAKQLANHITKVDLEGWKASTHRKIVQFHPSYSYEDFVQGIKPVKDGDAINYVLQPGIFQKLCKPTVILPTMSWRTAAIYVLNENTSLHYKEINKISYELGITPKDTWQLKSGYPRKTPWITQSREITEDIRTNNKNSIFKKSLNDDGEEISAMYELNLKSPTYEDEIRNLPEAVIDKSPKILIIDEINRGNLSKIFGELIYALEYRGEEIDLQYKEFSEGNDYGTLTIPLKDQLMIIGTMNTADRSIILFDAALRRRFSFIPLLPDYDLLAQSLDIDKEFDETEFKTRLKSLEEDGKDEKKKILSILALYKINLKLSDNVSVGREKQIGHTFLLEMQSHPENFTKIWAQDILPLLEEYYFESPETIEEWFTPDVYSKQKGIMEFNDTILEKSLNGLLFSPDE